MTGVRLEPREAELHEVVGDALHALAGEPERSRRLWYRASDRSQNGEESEMGPRWNDSPRHFLFQLALRPGELGHFAEEARKVH
jgi:hypothetical protein